MLANTAINYITNPNEEIADPKLFGIDAFKPENQFQANLVTENPNAILLQTRAADKYALAEEMNAFYQHELAINSWGGPLNILECAPKGSTKPSPFSTCLMFSIWIVKL